MALPGTSAIECPFFKDLPSDYNNHHSIKCEGCVKGATNILTFRNQADRDRHLNLYCYKSKKATVCPVYRMAWVKHERGD